MEKLSDDVRRITEGYGALTGVLLAGVLPVPFLYFLFAVILFLSAQQMLARRLDPSLASIRAADRHWIATLQLDSTHRGLDKLVAPLLAR